MTTNLCGDPIEIVSSGGVPVVNVYGLGISAPIFTPTNGKGGMVATIVSEHGAPVILVNDDGSEWTP